MDIIQKPCKLQLMQLFYMFWLNIQIALVFDSQRQFFSLLPAMLTEDLLYLGIILTFITIKLSSVLADPIDPFRPVESLSAWLCLGGLWENIQDSEGKQD